MKNCLQSEYSHPQKQSLDRLRESHVRIAVVVIEQGHRKYGN